MRQDLPAEFESRTLVLRGPRDLVWEAQAPITANAREVLVRVRRCGVCETDLLALAGRQPAFAYPRRLGRELCVQVIAHGGSRLKPGTLCAVDGYIACGRCTACHAGESRSCRNVLLMGIHVDGGFAPYLSVRPEKLHPVHSLTPDQVSLVEPLVIGADCVKRAGITRGDSVVVIGLGFAGIAVALFAKAAGAVVACVDASAEKLAFASRTLGIPGVFAPSAELPAVLVNYFGKHPAVVVDASNGRMRAQQSIAIAGDTGLTAFVGLFAGDVIFHQPEFNRRILTPITTLASIGGVFRQVIAQLESNLVSTQGLISHRFSFTEAPKHLANLLRDPSVIKALLDFDTP